jgi:hypothetical protein
MLFVNWDESLHEHLPLFLEGFSFTSIISICFLKSYKAPLRLDFALLIIPEQMSA